MYVLCSLWGASREAHAGSGSAVPTEIVFGRAGGQFGRILPGQGQGRDMNKELDIRGPCIGPPVPPSLVERLCCALMCLQGASWRGLEGRRGKGEAREDLERTRTSSGLLHTRHPRELARSRLGRSLLWARIGNRRECRCRWWWWSPRPSMLQVWYRSRYGVLAVYNMERGPRAHTRVSVYCRQALWRQRGPPLGGERNNTALVYSEQYGVEKDGDSLSS